MNKFKLKGAIASCGYTQRQLAELLGITNHTFSNKINGNVDFKLSEIEQMRDILKMNEETFLDIFYRKGETK